MGGYAATLNQRPDHLAVVCETESLAYTELDHGRPLSLTCSGPQVPNPADGSP